MSIAFRYSFTRMLLVALAVAAPLSLAAQERRAGPGPYDLSREVTVKGTVVRHYTMPSPASAEPELSILAVTIEGRPVQLILGPSDFVKKQRTNFTASLKVEVTGLPGAHLNSEEAMIVRKVKAVTQTLTLRDETGKPMWDK